jgi:hypothetical protein
MAIRLLNTGCSGRSRPSAGDRDGLCVPRRGRSVCSISSPSLDQTGRRCCLTPMEFLERLATLIPSPRRHRPSSHAILASNAPLRAVLTAHAGHRWRDPRRGRAGMPQRPPRRQQRNLAQRINLLVADHSFMLLARSGRNNLEVLSEVLDAVAGWI